MNDLVSKKEAAAFFRVSVQALDGWFVAGCPVAKRSTKGSVALVSLSAMARWRISRANRKSEPVADSDENALQKQIEAFVREAIGMKLIPAMWRMLLTAGAGYLHSDIGLDKERSVKAIVDLVLLLHTAAEGCFEDNNLDVDYPEALIEAAKAERDGSLALWVAKNWPDKPKVATA